MNEITRVRIFKAIGVWLPAEPERLADAIEKALHKAASTPSTYAQGQEETRKKIDAEIYRAVSDIAPNNVELLCILGSIGDSLSDEDVLECLEQYNEKGTCVAEMIISVNDTPSDRRARFKLLRALPIKEGRE